MSEGELLNALNLSKPVKKCKNPKTNFSKARIEKNLMNQDTIFLN